MSVYETISIEFFIHVDIKVERFSYLAVPFENYP
jgi:hypothetical protein